MSGGMIAAIVPVKPLGVALRRLAGVLSAPVRQELQEAMLTDVLGASLATPTLGPVLVVTADPGAARLAAAMGAWPISDHDPPQGMNAAVGRGLVAAGDLGAEGALVLVADLPLAHPDALSGLLAAPPAAVTLVPSRDGSGTNALLLRPPSVLVPELGPGSLVRHLRQASRLGLLVSRHDEPTLALDIDTPGDVAVFLETEPPCATRVSCTRLGVAEILLAARLQGSI